MDSPGPIGPWSTTTSRFIEGHLGKMLRGGEIVQFDQTANARFYESYSRTVEDDFLPREHWTQGRAIARAFQNVIRDSRSVVVSILDEADRHVSCGTIVEVAAFPNVETGIRCVSISRLSLFAAGKSTPSSEPRAEQAA